MPRDITKLSECRGFASPTADPTQQTHCARRDSPWEPAKRASKLLVVAVLFGGVGGLGLFLFGSCFGGGLLGFSLGGRRSILLT